MDISTKQTLIGPNAIPLLEIPLYNKIVIGSIVTLYCHLNKGKIDFKEVVFLKIEAFEMAIFCPPNKWSFTASATS